MPVFDAKTLHSDPDGLSVLAAVLHPTAKGRDEAVRRGRERLAQPGSLADAMARGQRSEGGRRLAGMPTV